MPGITKPNTRCDRTVDFMGIYPTLTDLCGVPTPSHVQGRSLRPLLLDPRLPWQPAITTYQQNNHTVRSEAFRYTRYADGGEELYDERDDPYEWTNLVRSNGKKLDDGTLNELKDLLPKDNLPPANHKE